jgi:hypothetical protein
MVIKAYRLDAKRLEICHYERIITTNETSMTIYSFLAIAAAIIYLFGFGLYVLSILQGKTQPNKASWTIWALVGGILAFTYYETGDIHTIWLPFSLFIGPTIVMLLSFKYGYAKWFLLDKICLVLAMITIIPWIFLDKPELTLVLNVLIDALGAIPTIAKCAVHPETEDRNIWAVFFISSALQLIAIQIWNIAAIYPLYLFVVNLLMVALLTLKQGKTQATSP